MATPETELKLLLKEFLLTAGWFVRHQLQRRYSYKGMPDIFITKHGVTIEVEVKSPVGRQSSEQIQYQEDLEEHGGHYAVIRSIDNFIDYLKENNL